MEYIIVLPIEGMTSEERAQAISSELFSLGRPPAVRNPEDVSQYVFGWVKHPENDDHALSVDLDYKIYVHVQNNINGLLELFPEVPQEEKEALSHYIANQVNRQFSFGDIIPSTATVRSKEEMDLLGWFPELDA